MDSERQDSFDRLPWRPRFALLLVWVACWCVCRPVTAGQDRTERLRQGDWLSRLGENERALSIWRELAAETPEDKDILLRLGATLGALHRYTEAESVLEKALKLDPNDPLIVHNLGLLRLNQGRMKEAETYFHRVLSIRPWQPETNYHLGLIAERRGDVAGARKLYLKELEVNAHCAKAWDRYLRLSPPGREISNRKAIELFVACMAVAAVLWLLKRRSEGIHT